VIDNLARKPRLTLVQGRELAHVVEADFIPELTESLVGKNKRRWWFDGEHSRWVTSLGIVLLMYAAPLAWWLWPDNAPGASLPPPAAMVVELAPAPVAPPAPTDQPPGPEQAEATPPPPEPKPLPEPEPELPPVPEAPEPEVALDPIEEPPLEESEPEQESPLKPEEPIEETPPEEKPASSASAPPEAPVEDVQTAAPNHGVSNPAVDRNRMLNWQSSLMMKLNEAKRYPSRARRSRHEGVAYLRFAMDREGAVLSASIERSSGYPLLDEETLELIERAQPLPKPPEDMAGESLEFVVPVEFFLNR
jgi:protein TonB|tara:strand:- start:93482 stop:94399 length:918 start_codon:yes stop_codon:yes gene_type:complete